MKYLTAGEASKMAGVSKATICRALKNGKLSYISIDTYGYKIDPAELSRVYNIKRYELSQSVLMKRSETPNETPRNDHEIELLKLKLEHAKKIAEIYKEQAEKWQKQASQLLLRSPQSDKNDIKKLVRDELINIIRKKRQQKNSHKL